MNEQDGQTMGLQAFIEQVWARVVFFFSIVSGVLGYIKLADGNSGLFTLVLIGVGVAGLLLSCVYYGFIWKPEINDGNSVIVISNSTDSVVSQRNKVKQRKRIRLIAKFGLLLIPILVGAGYATHQHIARLPPKDFKILVANFEGSDAENYSVTDEIFRNLEREMAEYEDVNVERIDRTIESIKTARQEGTEQKAAIVIWGSYNVIDKIVPISLNFEILKESADFPELAESVRGKTQPYQLSELTNFELQTNLSQEMTYLSLFTLGMYRYLEEDWQQAIDYFEQTLNVANEEEQSIDSLETEVVYFHLGRSYGSSKLYRKELASYDKAIEINPNFDDAWNNRGIALKDLGRHEQAVASYDKAIEINPNHDDAWNNRGIALGELGKYEQALASYDKAIEINPNHDEAWYSRGFDLGELGRHEQALASYDKAIEINPNNHRAWNNHGITLGELGRHEQELASYDKAIEINPNNHRAWSNRSLALGQLGKYEQAFASLDRAIKINPNYVYAWYNKAATYALQNNLDLALENLKKAFSLNPELREYIKTDPDFDAIREDERFKKLMETKF